MFFSENSEDGFIQRYITKDMFILKVHGHVGDLESPVNAL